MNGLPVTMRVRPVRVVVLIDRAAESTDFVRVIRFLSQLWGGRFCLILPVDADSPDPLTTFRLAYWRPDCVYGMGISQEQWVTAVNDACQPRQFCPLDVEVAEDVRKAVQSGLIHGDHAVYAMFKARHERSRFNRPLTVASIERTASLAPFCAAMFGVHPADLREDYRDETREPDPDNGVAFVDLCTEFSTNNWQTWLDGNSFDLSTYVMQSPAPEPTIVLVNDTIADLSLFWNLRTVTAADESPRVIPVPFRDASDPQLVAAVVRWLSLFDPVTNYCTVTSSSVSEVDSASFVQSVTEGLRDTSVKYIDYELPRNRVPRVIAFESQVTCSVKQDGQRIEFVPPKPTTLSTLGASDCWYVDLVGEMSSRRAIAEMLPPSSVAIPEILNGPCPPGHQHSAIGRFGCGLDSINVRCSSNNEVIKFYVPTAAQVLEEMIREGGYEPDRDEKRSSYIPTIDRFGGIYRAATALSGKSGEIIRAVSEKTLLPKQIKGICRLGGGALSIDNYLGRVNEMVRNDSARTRRIVRSRFEEYARGEVPEGVTLGPFLEHWADRSVLIRSWKLGPCSQCSQAWFAADVSIQTPIECPNCGNRVLLPEHVPIGYSLSRPVRHSVREGIIPVVLTGRFLRNLTNHSFFWLPGVKIKKGEKGGDADVVASCDGHLVFAECKRLVGVAPDANVWTEVAAQFLELAEVAIECRGDLVVLAAQADSIPDHVRKTVENSLRGRIAYEILNGADLEKGHRNVDKGPWTTIPDLLPTGFPEVRGTRTGGPREMKVGIGKFTKGG